MQKPEKKTETALKYDAGKPDLSQITLELVEGLARVRMYGQEKYTIKGKCTCAAQCVEKLENLGLEIFVSRATIELGDRLTKKELQNIKGSTFVEILGILLNEDLQHLKQDTTLITKDLLNFLASRLAQSVMELNNCVSTTTTRQELLENAFVNPVTLLLASWKKKNGLEKHLPTCDGLKIVQTGRDNWKNGFKITRSLSAALRHIFKFLSGQTKDEESGLSHLFHAVACLEHAIWDMEHHPENDDRYKP